MHTMDTHRLTMFCMPWRTRRFSPSEVKQICQEVFEERLAGIEWDEEDCKDLCLDLSDEIRSKVCERFGQPYHRYKIIVQTTIGENKQQGVLITSRCLWEQVYDNYASYSFKNVGNQLHYYCQPLYLCIFPSNRRLIDTDHPLNWFDLIWFAGPSMGECNGFRLLHVLGVLEAYSIHIYSW